jgi:hypothetical protein
MAPSTPGRLGYLGRKAADVLVSLFELGSLNMAGQDRCTLKAWNSICIDLFARAEAFII